MSRIPVGCFIFRLHFFLSIHMIVYTPSTQLNESSITNGITSGQFNSVFRDGLIPAAVTGLLSAIVGCHFYPRESSCRWSTTTNTYVPEPDRYQCCTNKDCVCTTLARLSTAHHCNVLKSRSRMFNHVLFRRSTQLYVLRF